MKRTNDFIADDAIPAFMERLNQVVCDGEAEVAPTVAPAPCVFVLGAPRSGTTVLMQWLSQIGFAVPSNIAARFYQTPYFAGLLQRLLSDPKLNYKDELSIGLQEEYRSDYGKTAGLLSPHEFSYFIRKHVPVTVGEELTPEQKSQSDIPGLVNGLSLFGHGLGQPVAIKGLLLQYVLDLFAETNNVIFLHTVRQEVDNVVSLFRHRQHVAGDDNEWISVRPPEYPWLKDLSPIEQVAGQVHFTNRALRRQLDAMKSERSIVISHEDFCFNPAALHQQIQERLSGLGSRLSPYAGPESFETTKYDQNSDSYRAAEAALISVQSKTENEICDQKIV